MSAVTITIYAGKASDLTPVETVPAPHRLNSRRVTGNYLAFCEANRRHEAGDFTPLTRILAIDSTGRVLGGYYVKNFERTRV